MIRPAPRGPMNVGGQREGLFDSKFDKVYPLINHIKDVGRNSVESADPDRAPR